MTLNPDHIIVYGTTWCGDTRRARKFLDEHHIEYEWVDIDTDPEAARYVQSVNHGNRSVPTILFPDGSTLTEPSAADLGLKLGV